ncbi:MAG: tRNA lysidine(34) synthetase TilS, partial [Christensenellales bacterium]
RRNKLRNEIIPMIKQVYPGFVDNVVRLSQLAVSTADFVDKFVVKAQIKNGEMLLTDELLTCEETILTASLFDGLERMGRRVNIERKHIEAIKSLTNKPPGSMVCLPDNLAAYRDRNGIVVAPGRKSGFEKTKVDYGVFELGVWKVEIVKENCLGALRADMDILGRGMLRQREKGDRICKFGGGSKSLGDYLTDKKVPLRERDDLVIIAEGNDVLAVLPVDISSKVAVTQTTKNVAYIKTTKITGEK